MTVPAWLNTGVASDGRPHLATIIQHKHLPMLKWGHGASICVEVWICKTHSILVSVTQQPVLGSVEMTVVKTFVGGAQHRVVMGVHHPK